MNKNLEFYAICEAIEPILYAVAVIIGGLLRPDCCHITQATSELIEAGAPKQTVIGYG